MRFSCIATCASGDLQSLNFTYDRFVKRLTTYAEKSISGKLLVMAAGDCQNAHAPMLGYSMACLLDTYMLLFEIYACTKKKENKGLYSNHYLCHSQRQVIFLYSPGSLTHQCFGSIWWPPCDFSSYTYILEWRHFLDHPLHRVPPHSQIQCV